MHRFDQDVALVSSDPCSFTGKVSENWSINTIPNGGYLMAIMANAMMQCSKMKSTPIVTANFINRCEPGEAQVLIDKMVTSRQFDRSQTRLLQGGKEKIRAFGTFADENNECILESYEGTAPDLSALEKCVAVPGMPGYSLFEQLDIRLTPESAGWFAGELTDAAVIKGWVKFRNERAFDIPSLLLVADSFPPAVFASRGMVAWVPTIEFSVNVRKIPATEWLQCIFRTRFITCGLLEEDGEIWDPNGGLVAISRQIAQYRVHAR